jgi:hypothetical protein
MIDESREVNDMRNMLTTLFRATLLLIVVTLSGLGAQEKPGDLPVRNKIHRQYQLAPNTTVEISMIAGRRNRNDNGSIG